MPWKETDAMNERSEFVLRAIETDNFRELCREYGISPKTGYKWRERFLQRGLAGMADESRRPDNSPGELSEAVVCEMVRLKEAHRGWGPRKIRELYARVHGRAATPSESSFKRVLDRAGLVEKRRVRKREQCGRLQSGRRAGAPNEVWTVDFKGWWHTANGQRCEPLTVRDEFSRYVLELRRLEDASGQSVRARFEELFRKYGLPGAIRSDNGPPFASVRALLGLTRLSAWWLALGIDLERGRPGCPQDNGGHERLHLDIARELQAAREGEEQAVLDSWRETFNNERPHEALAMRCPAEVYSPSIRSYEGGIEALTYPGMRTLRVTGTGCIMMRQQGTFRDNGIGGVGRWVGSGDVDNLERVVWALATGAGGHQHDELPARRADRSANDKTKRASRMKKPALPLTTRWALRRAPANGAPCRYAIDLGNERGSRPMAALPHWRPHSLLDERKCFGYDEKSVTRIAPSVTHVLTHECYLCPDCALRPPPFCILHSALSTLHLKKGPGGPL